MLDPSSSATRTSLQRALTDGIMREASFSLLLSLLFSLSSSSAFTFLYYLLARHNARPLDSSSTSAGYAPSAMQFLRLWIYYSLWFIIFTILCYLDAQCTRFLDSSSPKERSREKEWDKIRVKEFCRTPGPRVANGTRAFHTSTP